jgi:hypothetical protein
MWRALLEHLFVAGWVVQWHLYLIALLLPVGALVVVERRLTRRG